MKPTPKATVETLLRREWRLDRSFEAVVVALVGSFLFVYLLGHLGSAAPVSLYLIAPWLPFLLLACYAWYVVEAILTARAVGRSPWLIGAWLLAAPFLSLLPIPVVALVLQASPLILKFILARELRAQIHQQTFD